MRLYISFALHLYYILITYKQDMNMKKIIYSLLSILLCGLQSCVDLDMAPYNQVASGNMWSNAALTNQGVAGVYAKMRGWGDYYTSYIYNVVPFE